MVLYHCMNAGSVMEIPWGGGDTRIKMKGPLGSFPFIAVKIVKEYIS